LLGHANDVYGIYISPDEKELFSVSEDGTLRKWLFNGKLENIFKEKRYVGSDKIYYTEMGERTGTCTLGDDNWISVSSFFPFSEKILIASRDSIAKIYNLNGSIENKLIGHSKGINCATISNDGKFMLTGSFDKTVRLWDKTGKCLHIFAESKYIINSVAFSSDNQRIAISDYGKDIRIYDFSGKKIKDIYSPNTIYAVMFIHDDDYVFVVMGRTGQGIIFNMHGKDTHSFNGKSIGNYPFYTFCNMPKKNKFILSSLGGQNIYLLDTTLNNLMIWQRHTDRVNDAKLSDDGKYLLSGSNDQTFRLWDEDGNDLFSMEMPTTVRTVSFSPKGDKFIIGTGSNKAYLYEMKIPYKEFIKDGNYEKLSKIDQLKYGILIFNDAFNFTHLNELIDAGSFYYDNYLAATNKIEKQKYFRSAVEIFDKISESDSIQGLISLGLQFSEYFSEDENNKFCFPEKSYNLYEKALGLCKSDTSTRTTISWHCPNIIYKLVKRKLFEDALKFAELAVKADDKLKISYTNLPFCYILTNNWEKAKQLYLEWKDKPYNEEESFRDVFLYDLDDLESMGITHPDFNKVRELLKEKKN